MKFNAMLVRWSQKKWLQRVVYSLYILATIAAVVLTNRLSVAGDSGGEANTDQTWLTSAIAFLGLIGWWSAISTIVAIAFNLLYNYMVGLDTEARDETSRNHIRTFCKDLMSEHLRLIRDRVPSDKNLHGLKVTLFVPDAVANNELFVLARSGGGHSQCKHRFPVSGTNMGVVGQAYCQEDTLFIDNLPDLHSTPAVDKAFVKDYAEKTFVTPKVVTEELSQKKKLNRRMPRSFVARAIKLNKDNTAVLGVIVVDCSKETLPIAEFKDIFDALVDGLQAPLERWKHETN